MLLLRIKSTLIWNNPFWHWRLPKYISDISRELEIDIWPWSILVRCISYSQRHAWMSSMVRPVVHYITQLQQKGYFFGTRKKKKDCLQATGISLSTLVFSCSPSCFFPQDRYLDARCPICRSATWWWFQIKMSVYHKEITNWWITKRCLRYVLGTISIRWLAHKKNIR